MKRTVDLIDPPEEWLSIYAFKLNKVINSWWSRPVRNHLRELHMRMICYAVEIRQMRRHLDALIESERCRELEKVKRSQFEIAAEIDQALGRWQR